MLCILSNSSEVPITTLDILLQFPSPANFLLFSLTLLIALYFLLAFPKLSPANPNLNFPKVTWLPFPVPLVLQGYLTLHHLQCSGIHLFSHLTSLYGPTFHLPFGPLPVLCTADPLIISKLLSSPNPSHLQKSGYIYKRLFVEQLHEGLFVSQYFTWFPHRKCLSRAFTYNSLLTYIPIINQRAQELTTEITRTFPNFHQLLGVNLLHLVSDLMVGFQAHSAENIENLHKSIETHKECLLHVFRYPYLFLHPFWKFSGKKPASDRATLQMRTAMKQIISSSRFLSQSNPGAPGDLKFKPLLGLMQENQWTEKEILDNFASLIFAEHEAMYAALQFCLLLLALHPPDQERCFSEIDTIFATQQKHQQPNSHLSICSVSQLKYLDLCILEALRLLPPVPVFARRLRSPLTISPGCTLPRGQTIMVMPWALHRDPLLYPNPLSFEPNRFLQQKRLYTYIPFSAGRRNCLGWKLSQIQLKIVLAHILHRFRVTTTDTLENMRLLYAVRIIPEKNISLIFTPRLNTK